MRFVLSTRVLPWLLPLLALALTPASTRPDEPAAKSDEALAAVPKEALRYDGKPFAYWRDYGLTELKAERRIECLRALAAFGSNGYGREAAQAVLELIKGYRLVDFPNGGDPTPEQKVVASALEAILRVGEPAVPLILESLNTPTERQFARLVLSELDIPASAVPTLVKLVQSREPDTRSLAVEILADKLKAIRPSLLAALQKPETADAFVRSLSAVIRSDKVQAWRAMGIAETLGLRARGAVPAMIEVLRAGIEGTTPPVVPAGFSNTVAVGPAAVPGIAPSPEDRISQQLEVNASSALTALGKVSPNAREVLPALLKLLKESAAGSEKQLRCIYVLGQLGPAARKALPALNEALRGASPEQRAIITGAIQRIQGDSREPPGSPQGGK